MNTLETRCRWPLGNVKNYRFGVYRYSDPVLYMTFDPAIYGVFHNLPPDPRIGYGMGSSYTIKVWLDGDVLKSSKLTTYSRVSADDSAINNFER
ncbi:MAG: hypothetical protein LBH03_02910 [Holophagales bacterium]|jgi:hypothetical protein|nr:hypothetical protein [Holophagales bacterium]